MSITPSGMSRKEDGVGGFAAGFRAGWRMDPFPGADSGVICVGWLDVWQPLASFV